MHPTRTIYRLTTEEDEDRLFDWLREKMGIISHIGWPCLVVERDDELLGCIVTQAREDAVVCGPIYAENAIIASRLVNIYEALLAKLGIKEYLFSVVDSESSPVIRTAKRKKVPLTALGMNDGQWWYKRRIA